MSSMERYDESSAMHTSREAFGACVVNGEVYAIGGFSSGNFSASGEKYSSLSDSWSAITPMPLGRARHAAVAMGSGIYVLGGTVPGSRRCDDVCKYDSRRGTWTQVAPMPEEMMEFAACALGTDIYIFGGSDDRASPQRSVFKLDTLSNAWIALAPMPYACASRSASVLDGLAYILEARDGNDNLRFDPATELWSYIATNLTFTMGKFSFVTGRCL
jgi:N-acetylneuraminic acid mutarotase